MLLNFALEAIVGTAANPLSLLFSHRKLKSLYFFQRGNILFCVSRKIVRSKLKLPTTRIHDFKIHCYLMTCNF